MKHSVLQVYNRIYICMVNQHTTVHKCLNVNKIEAISTQASPCTSNEGWPWTQLELFHSRRLKHPELSLGFQQQHIHGSSAPDKLQYLLLSFLGLHLLQATSTIVKARDWRPEGKEVTKADSKTMSRVDHQMFPLVSINRAISYTTMEVLIDFLLILTIINLLQRLNHWKHYPKSKERTAKGQTIQTKGTGTWSNLSLKHNQASLATGSAK